MHKPVSDTAHFLWQVKTSYILTDKVLSTDMDWTRTRLQTEDGWGCDCETAETHLQQTLALTSMLYSADRCTLLSLGALKSLKFNNFTQSSI